MTTPRVISRDTTSTELDSDYKWGFTIDIDSDLAPKGLSEDVVRLISAKKEEPGWAAGMAPQGFPPLGAAQVRRAGLGQHPPRPHRLPGHLLLRRPVQ